MRSGATHRACGARYGTMLRHKYDEVGLPCRKTTGSPAPVSAYEIQVPMSSSFLRGCGSAAEICVWLSLMNRILLASMKRAAGEVVRSNYQSVVYLIFLCQRSALDTNWPLG